jgi:hypothetical protein
MKFFQRIFNTQHTQQIKTSGELLREDFGEFPPKPLICADLEGQIKIITAQGAGEIYQDLLNTRRLLRGAILGETALSKEAIEYFDKSTLHDPGGANTFYSRLLKEAAIALALCWRCLLLALKKINPKKTPAKLGYFMPIGKSETEIVVLSGQHRMSGRRVEPTVSHEHIHALQNHHSDGCSKRIQNPTLFLEKKYAHNTDLLYKSERKELEARLHEVVLSYFRHQKTLPTNFCDFLGLLVSNDALGSYARALLEGNYFKFPTGLTEYKTREFMYAEDIADVICRAKDESISLRFITEVLPVMYGNLLRYYGDEGASAKYLEEIKRPNLFDELYGLDPLPRPASA